MDRELIPCGVFQGLPALVLDGGLATSSGPDWMRAAAGAHQGPFLLRRCTFPLCDVALERLMSSREEAPVVWREVQTGGDWPSTHVWTVLDVTSLLAPVGLDAAATRAALAELPPMGPANELVMRSVTVAASALDEAHAWLAPGHAWVVVSAADLPAATRLVSRCLTPWGARVG